MPLFGRKSLPDTFPDVRAIGLDGDETTLPAELPAPLTLVIVLFRDEADLLSDQWARLGHQLEASYPDQFAVIETPVVGRGMKLFGSLATVGIRGQVEGDDEHARTLPIYVDKKPFRKALKLSDESDVYPFLVERDSGRILWAGRGTIDMEEVRTLEATLADHLGPTTTSGDATDTPDNEPEVPAAFDGPGDLAVDTDPPEASGG